MWGATRLLCRYKSGHPFPGFWQNVCQSAFLNVIYIKKSLGVEAWNWMPTILCTWYLVLLWVLGIYVTKKHKCDGNRSQNQRFISDKGTWNTWLTLWASNPVYSQHKRPILRMISSEIVSLSTYHMWNVSNPPLCKTLCGRWALTNICCWWIHHYTFDDCGTLIT